MVIRVLSGIRATGRVHIGNYFGSLTNWLKDQEDFDAFYFLADLHSLDERLPPEKLKNNILDLLCHLLAIGLDPNKCTIFQQSRVSEHTELMWILGSLVSFGELRRMTQFKEKQSSHKSEFSIFAYPVLMASDILLYNPNLVPVGEDQIQHLELTRNLAERFNKTYGDTFLIPSPSLPRIGKRIMDLQNPTAKMSKSGKNESGIIFLDEDPSSIKKKIGRAVTDSESEIRYDFSTKPGVSNLIEIFCAATDSDNPSIVAGQFKTYAELKEATSDALIARLEPVREALNELRKDIKQVEEVLKMGSEKARNTASTTLESVKKKIGLI